MANNHTPGPWSVSGNEIRKDNGVPFLLATVNNSDGAKINGYDAEANAKLMAAAPELLEVVEKIAKRLEEYPGFNRAYSEDEQEWLEALGEAIKKATT